MRYVWMAVILSALAGTMAGAPAEVKAEDPAWKKGVFADPNFFPLTVWAQNPAYAKQYKAAGINAYTAMGNASGTMDERLKTLQDAGMYLICGQNERTLQYKDSPVIIAWMHGDEPDNAQELPKGETGWGPPIPPAKIVEGYNKICAADSSRPVLLNLGVGVAWDGWYGRGVRENHPEDYPEYVKGADIVSYDIYPACDKHKEIQGNLWYVPFGVRRLVNWAGPGRRVWNCIETTKINSDSLRATPSEIRSEVWMSIIHGSRGIIYFCHDFVPTTNDNALLDYPEIVAGVTALNREITALAPVINSPDIVNGASVTTSGVPVDTLVKRHNDDIYVFAATMRNGESNPTFTVKALPGEMVAEVIGENRSIIVNNGQFKDSFGGYDVHLYRIHW